VLTTLLATMLAALSTLLSALTGLVLTALLLLTGLLLSAAALLRVALVLLLVALRIVLAWIVRHWDVLQSFRGFSREDPSRRLGLTPGKAFCSLRSGTRFRQNIEK
jgi:hypothetical protein